MQKFLEKLERIIILLGIVLVPLGFATNFPNPFETVKIGVLVLTVITLVSLKAIGLIFTNRFRIGTSPLDLPLLVILFAYLISGVFITPNKMEGFFLPGNATIMISLILFYFLISSSKIGRISIIYALITGSVIASIINLLSYTKVFETFPGIPGVFKLIGFTPTGGVFPHIILISGAILLTIHLILNEKDILKKLFSFVVLVILSTSIALSLNTLLRKNQAIQFLSLRSSWEITAETLKHAPLFGIGPSNFLGAFNKYRPLEFNKTSDWNLKFASARNFPLNLAAETGILGTFGIILLGIGLWRYLYDLVYKQKRFNWVQNLFTLSALVLSIIYLFIFPPFLISLFLFIILLSILNENEGVEFNFGNSTLSSRFGKFPSLVIALPVLLISGILCFWVMKVLYAEYLFNQSLNLLNGGNIEKGYKTMQNAINLNPRVDRYRATFSELNLAIVQNIKSDDQNVLSQSINTSINEAKATVALNKDRSETWQVLANVYVSLLFSVQGADNFSISTLNQAIALDPINPNLRIALGRVYFSLGKFDEAVDAFKLAIVAKDDLPNTHYNLALTYKELKDFKRALTEMNIVKNLISKDSEDYKLVVDEINNLEKGIASPSESGTELNTPAYNVPALENTLELPPDASPPTN